MQHFTWLLKNRKWIFSGIGLMVGIWVVRRMTPKRSLGIQVTGNANKTRSTAVGAETATQSRCVSVQERLFGRYVQFHADTGISDDLAGKVSAPVLLHVFPEWMTSSPRVLVVGQHTSGWGIDRRYHGDPHGRCHSCPYPEVLDFYTWMHMPREIAIRAMQHAYEVFNLCENQPATRNSSLWQAFRTISEGTANNRHGTLMTNLFRMDFAGKSPCLDEEGVRKPLSRAQRSLLRDEIRILRPDAVVFFTGVSKQCPWKYDDEIREEFPGIVFADFQGNASREIAVLRHDDLPAKTVRTHHPQVLRLRRQWSYLTDITEWINDRRRAGADANRAGRTDGALARSLPPADASIQPTGL